eukprot:ANDGO_01489.mRNA.1 hypothetical protein
MMLPGGQQQPVELATITLVAERVVDPKAYGLSVRIKYSRGVGPIRVVPDPVSFVLEHTVYPGRVRNMAPDPRKKRVARGFDQWRSRLVYTRAPRSRSNKVQSIPTIRMIDRNLLRQAQTKLSPETVALAKSAVKIDNHASVFRLLSELALLGSSQALRRFDVASVLLSLLPSHGCDEPRARVNVGPELIKNKRFKLHPGLGAAISFAEATASSHAYLTFV